MWVTSFDGNTVTRIDPLSDRVTGTTSLAPDGTGPIGVAAAAGGIWVANHDGSADELRDEARPRHDGAAARDPRRRRTVRAAKPARRGRGLGLDPRDQHLRRRPDRYLDGHGHRGDPCQGRRRGIAANDTDVWVAGGGGPGCQPGITRIDAETNTVTAHVNAAGRTAPLALDGRTLWYGTWDSHQLGRLDTRTNTVTGLPKLPGRPFVIAAYGGYVWMTDRDDGLLFKVRHQVAERTMLRPVDAESSQIEPVHGLGDPAAHARRHRIHDQWRPYGDEWRLAPAQLRVESRVGTPAGRPR